MAGLPDVLDPSTLPLAARIAQVMLASTVIAHLAVLRPANARADLLLVADMIQSELTDDIRAGRLPVLDPHVERLRRTLTSAQLSRKALAQNNWWSKASTDRSAALTTVQQSRLDDYQHQLDTATRAYCRVMRPWRGLWPFQAPRHFHGRHWSRIGQSQLQAREFEPSLFFAAVPEPSIEAPGMMPAPREPAPSITLAISRARGVDPADANQKVELGHASLDDVIGPR